MSTDDIERLMEDLGIKFKGRSYNLLTRNCNHFTEELVQILCDKPMPRWINRLAGLGTWMPCIVTAEEYIDPPTATEHQYSQQ